MDAINGKRRGENLGIDKDKKKPYLVCDLSFISTIFETLFGIFGSV